MTTWKILSIDGGGIRGLIAASFLTRLEQETGKKISSLFHLISGTSTGGIIALALSKPNPLAAQAVRDLYFENAKKIFKKATIFETIGCKYTDSGVQGILKNTFGETNLSDSIMPLLITSYDIGSRSCHIFRSWDAIGSLHNDYSMLDVALATSAAPTYFPPAVITNCYTKSQGTSSDADKLILIDGGIFANNPSLYAYTELSKITGKDDSVMIVSVGTGAFEPPYEIEAVKKWVDLEWIKPFINMSFASTSETKHSLLKKLISNTNDSKNQYYRFQIELQQQFEKLDHTEKEKLKQLVNYGKNMAKSDEFTNLVNILGESPDVSHKETNDKLSK